MKAKKGSLWLLAVLAAQIAAAAGWSRQPPGLALPSTATVIHVLDGDSFIARLADGQSSGIRLIGVNAPEMTDERPDVRVWAFLAKRFAAYHLEGRKVKLEFDWNLKDKYGRLLAYVRSWGGELFNEKIIRQGYAYVFLQYPFRGDYQELFRRSQQEAVRLGRGLWAKNPPPQISLAEVRERVGDYVSLRFFCAKAREGKYYLFLDPKDSELRVFLRKEKGVVLPPAGRFKNRMILVSGLLEKQGSQAKMYVLFLPRMILVTND